MRVICPGSFDPVTLGHLDIVTRAANLFDEVMVGVGTNTAKNSLFSPEERIELMRTSVAHLPGVEVRSVSGLMVDFCLEHEITAIVKGLRFAADFDHELQMAQMNARLSTAAPATHPAVETILLPTSAEYAFISSTLVREIATLGGDVTAFVPDVVTEAIRARAAAR